MLRSDAHGPGKPRTQSPSVETGLAGMAGTYHTGPRISAGAMKNLTLQAGWTSSCSALMKGPDEEKAKEKTTLSLSKRRPKGHHNR